MRILIFGNGYIGNRCKDVWGTQADLTDRKVHSVQDVLEEIEKHKPDVVLNAAGVRGKPNVDWCDLPENMGITAIGNVALPIFIAEGCRQTNKYLLHIGSGCIFYGNSSDPKGWKEDDLPNPKVHYSKCKYAADLSLMTMPHVGIARIRVPLDDRPYPGNILDKLLNYPKIIDVQNSLTVIPDMVEVFYHLLERKGQGVFHVTNPGAVSYRRIVDYFKELIDSNIEKTWLTEGELVSQGLASNIRSTNVMQSTRLEGIGIHMNPIGVALDKAIRSWAQLKKAED
jgi:3,5-epimerase/4-reductase